MVNGLLAVLINFFSLYMALQYHQVRQKEQKSGLMLQEEKPGWRRFFAYGAYILALGGINLCCFGLFRDPSGVSALFFGGMIAVVLLFETMFTAVKENDWEERQKRQEYISRRQLQYYERQYEALSHFQTSMRKERHEQKNKTIELLSLLQQGNLEGLRERLMQEQNRLKASGYEKTTGNRTIDAVLAFELALARENEITTQLQIGIPSTMEVSDSVLCGVLGNALDNAIEACCYLPKEKRSLHIYMKVEMKNLFIEIRNSFDGIVMEEKGSLISRKQSRAEHGMGMHIMKELLHEADGTLEYQWDETQFTLRIVLYHVI